jgi:hypothetical protein
MPQEVVTLLSVDRNKNEVIVEFSNGRVGTYEAQFLLDHIEDNGNREVPDSDLDLRIGD